MKKGIGLLVPVTMIEFLITCQSDKLYYRTMNAYKSDWRQEASLHL